MCVTNGHYGVKWLPFHYARGDFLVSQQLKLLPVGVAKSHLPVFYEHKTGRIKHR